MIGASADVIQSRVGIEVVSNIANPTERIDGRTGASNWVPPGIIEISVTRDLAAVGQCLR